MNLYFILEGDQTEPKVYPIWIETILDNYSKIDFEHLATNNNYYIFSGGGIPSIYNHTVNAIKNINQSNLFHKLIVCLDGEEIGIEKRKTELIEFIEKSGVSLINTCELVIIVQEVCIETWFLGNKKIVKTNPHSSTLLDYKTHFDVKLNDPELMPNLNFHTNAQFHFSYFREVLKERNLTYRKSRPNIVMEQSYFKEMNKRIEETNHLKSFKDLIDLLVDIKK